MFPTADRSSVTRPRSESKGSIDAVSIAVWGGAVRCSPQQTKLLQHASLIPLLPTLDHALPGDVVQD